MLRVLIVYVEPLARENLGVLLQEHSDIEVAGECANAIEAIGAVHKLRPDVLFLDIQMPRISGLEMVGMLDPQHRPYIVFLTAFDEYAVKAFEEHAFDYLLIRCHRQYLVNMAHLKEIRLEDNGQAELVLRAGQTVPVSRRYLKSLKEAIGL